MIDNLSHLELLPNEILVEIFQYFDARDLFQAFYNLNFRLNILLQSLNNLYFTLLISNPDDNIFSPYIHTLILNHRTTINLNNFTNIHRLKLIVPTHEQLKQLKYNHFPHLEYLSIGYQNNHFSHYMPHLYEKIFSNGFPNLKSCDLFEPRIIPQILSSKQSSSLCILKVEGIRILTYQVILSTCPNLYFLQFTAIDSSEKQCQVKIHNNLKRMIIKYVDFLDVLNDGDINLYLSYVPNLEYLILHRNNPDADIEKYLKYQWLAVFIDCYLPLLRRFKCYFHVFKAKQLIKYDKENILKRIEANFKKIHNHRYQSQFIYNLSPLSFLENMTEKISKNELDIDCL
jgi:hypothetical protein